MTSEEQFGDPLREGYLFQDFPRLITFMLKVFEL